MKQYKVGYTTGVFDMFHIGHLNVLRNAKDKCDCLIVGVSTDELVKSYKHKTPVIPFNERIAIVESIKYVDKIEKQVACLESLDDSWGMCYTGYQLIKEHGDYQISSEKRCGDCYIDALMRTMFMGSGSNLLLRKSVVDEICGYDETFQRNQDIEFLTRACEHYKLAYVDEVLLTIYQEGNRAVRSFEQLDGYTRHYLEKFESRINSLEPRDRERVLAVISLDRFRVSLLKKKLISGIKILRENHVKHKYFNRYIR